MNRAQHVVRLRRDNRIGADEASVALLPGIAHPSERERFTGLEPEAHWDFPLSLLPPFVKSSARTRTAVVPP